ncbi:MAG TPA: TadE/TadG family type IV pilus assembly protein [Stellaceae bacterium]|nr:TadE/TadG family type IV pilus assembly protein [Stellaceae bacterium]
MSPVAHRADRFLRLLARSRSGIAAVEFALVLPVLSFMVVGLLAFGAALNNYVDLTEGVRAAARVLAQSAAYPTVPYSTAQTFFNEATTNLTAANLTLYVYVNGTQCTDDTSCSTALSGAEGDPVTVTATYSLCVTVMGHNFLPSCQLSASTTQIVE